MNNKQWKKVLSKSKWPMFYYSVLSHEIKRCLLLGRKSMTNLDSIKKKRHHFANKGPYSQKYGFSSSHVQV